MILFLRCIQISICVLAIFLFEVRKCEDNLSILYDWNINNTSSTEKSYFNDIMFSQSRNESILNFQWLLFEKNSAFLDICNFALSLSYYSSTAFILHSHSDFVQNSVLLYYQKYVGPVVLSDKTFFTDRVTIMFLSNETYFFNATDHDFRDLSVFYIFIVENVFSDMHEIFDYLWAVYRLYNYLMLCGSCNDVIFEFDVEWRKVIELKSENLPSRIDHHLGKFKHWHKTEIKTVIFARAPSLLYDLRGGVKLKGYDGMVLNCMDKYLNISLLLYHTMDDERFGYVLGNGTFVGTMKDVVDRTVDFTGNAHFVKWYNVSFLDFTHYVTSEKLCISVPKKGQVPNFFAIFKTLNPVSAVTFLATYGSIGFLYAGFKLLYVKIHIYRSYNISTALQMFLMSIGGSIPLKGNLWSEKLLLGPLFIMSLFTVNTFQSTLMTFLTTPSFYSDINSLDELRESNIEIWTSSKDLSFLEDVGLNIVVKPQKVMIDAQKNNWIGRIIRFNILSGNQDTYGGFKVLTPYHVVKECLGNFYVSYMLPKGSPLMNGLNWLVSSLIESGIIIKWIHETDRLTATTMKPNTNQKLTVISNPFKLSDLSAAYLFLSIGILLGFVTFLVELLVFYRVNKSNIVLVKTPAYRPKTIRNKITILPYLN